MTKTIKVIIITLFLGLGLSNAYAGAGHSHNVSEAKIERAAKFQLNKLISLEKIDSSWENAEMISMKKRVTNSEKEWLVSFKNSKIEDKTKDVLYIYLTTYGKVKGANYIGN